MHITNEKLGIYVLKILILSLAEFMYLQLLSSCPAYKQSKRHLHAALVYSFYTSVLKKNQSQCFKNVKAFFYV